MFKNNFTINSKKQIHYFNLNYYRNDDYIYFDDVKQCDDHLIVLNYGREIISINLINY